MKSKYFSNKILFIVPLFYYNFLNLFHVTLIATNNKIIVNGEPRYQFMGIIIFPQSYVS